MATADASFYDVLAVMLDGQPSPAALLGGVDDMLAALLRRDGDELFRAAARQAYGDGIVGRTLEEQHIMARALLGVVLEKRPDIAEAWRARHRTAGPSPVQRRALDRAPPAPCAADEPPPPADPAYRHALAESLVAHHVAGTLVDKIKPLHLAPPPPPSYAYCQSQPFFLLRPAFAEALDEFLRGPLMALCRPALAHRVYDVYAHGDLDTETKRRALIDVRRDVIWKIVGERLTILADDLASALDKMAAADDDGEPEYRTVMVAVREPRTYHIMGVSFQLGDEVVLRETRVRVRSATALEDLEKEAVATQQLFDDICRKHGVILPEIADLGLLPALLELDGKNFAVMLDDFVRLGSHPDTTRRYLCERLAAIDRAFAPCFADAVQIFLFYLLSEQTFTFKDLYDRCVEAGRSRSDIASRRPFSPSEVSRRPLELVAQLRLLMAGGDRPENIAKAAYILLSAWRVLASIRFEADQIRARQAIAGLAEDGALGAEVAQLLIQALDASPPDDQQAARAVAKAVIAHRRAG